MTLIYWIAGIAFLWLLLRKFMKSIEKPNEQPEPIDDDNYID